jgi:hypothetical protein
VLVTETVSEVRVDVKTSIIQSLFTCQIIITGMSTSTQRCSHQVGC